VNCQDFKSRANIWINILTSSRMGLPLSLLNWYTRWRDWSFQLGRFKTEAYPRSNDFRQRNDSLSSQSPDSISTPFMLCFCTWRRMLPVACLCRAVSITTFWNRGSWSNKSAYQNRRNSIQTLSRVCGTESSSRCDWQILLWFAVYGPWEMDLLLHLYAKSLIGIATKKLSGVDSLWNEWSSSDRTMWMASLNSRDRHVLGYEHRTERTFGVRPRNNVTIEI
jgi:hypothetical protein